MNLWIVSGVLLLLTILAGVLILTILAQKLWLSPQHVNDEIGFIPSEAVLKTLANQRETTTRLRIDIERLLERKYKILVVDDEVDTRMLFRLRYRKFQQYAFFFAENTQIAEVIASRLPIDLAIVDYKVPEINGLELAVKLQQIRPRIKIIIMSAFLDVETAQGLNAINVPALSKPIDFTDLSRLIALQLGQK